MRTAIRRICALILLAACATAAYSAPALTTVQDMVYKADGTPFNGLAFIEWKSFAAADSSNILTQSVTVAIVNGVLKVQLVPTTNAIPAAKYSVRYNSDGRIQFEETWAVPPSSTPLKLKDVRITSMGGLTAAPLTSQILESDVANLPADLAARPVKGANYGPSRAAAINADGALEAVAGNSSDCVRVDGTAAPCSPVIVDAEVPDGPVDGTNRTFFLLQNPKPAASLAMYRNGLLLKQGLDYSLEGNVITFVQAATPRAGDVLQANYRVDEAITEAAFARAGQSASLGTPRFRLPGRSDEPAEIICTNIRGNPTGKCSIPGNLLGAADRIEIRFDLSNQSAPKFSVVRYAAVP